jgi:hypothetical protein
MPSIMHNDEIEQSSGASSGVHHEGKSLSAVYFCPGQYFDKVITRPGWATSRTGQNGLETLHDTT